MSDNIPTSSLPRKRSKRKYDKTKLPTPPPDPTEPDKEDFIAYLDSLQKSYSRSTSTFAPVIVTEDAFDHLEKLYKLMEQMLELREQNARLHRRVRDLEHLNNLEKMHKDLDERLKDDCPELDKDTAFAETILESILAEPKTPKSKSKLRQSIYRRPRHRSGSVSVAMPPAEPSPTRRASVTPIDTSKKTAKVSKWTKVKAAFKWEKASMGSDAKSQDSGIGVVGPVEVARYLRVPSCDDHSHSPVDSGAGEVYTPGTLSTASSAEDFNRHEAHEDFRSSDDEHSHYIPHSKEGSQKSNKSHKTPWAKMKDIIQTRNSFKKKHRLSAHSDDVQIDIEFCSDNEEVFEDDGGDVPPEVVARYRSITDDVDKKASKWTRVKNAFLPPPDQAKEEEDEIQRNYKQLQKKLSQEFQEKLTEWERMKQTSPNTSNPSSSCGYTEESKDPAFMKKMEEWQKLKSQPSIKKNIPMTTEENLPPEFKKKLQEWEKIRKGSGKEVTKKKLSEVPRWKSLSGPKSEGAAYEYQNLSEDFRKKLEEWKQIKAGSPKQARKESSPKHCKKKETHEKELQWFEKELSKIEKEKQRLERERQKFLEREEALSKLRNSVLGGLKKEVLIHTPSGFYRFEGISRKFTQKLYEWEKAQGIAPESSTFALLNSSLSQEKSKPKTPNGSPHLIRSKSADSIAVSALNLACPLMSHQPSSLSLNDVEELEKECLDDSRSSSVQFLTRSHETLNEPEALIVEIEDIVEETAAPLHTYVQEKPVYQREELKTMCEVDTSAAPKIRRSESARAQTNYNLIEEIFSILKNLMENELEIQKMQDLVAEQESKEAPDLIRLKMFDEAQKAMAVRLSDKVVRLQEANTNVFSNITKEEAEANKQVLETLETVQDLSSEIYHLTETLDDSLDRRNIFEATESGARSLNPVTETAKDIRNKMLELRRSLTYICAASDLTAPRRRFSTGKKKVSKSVSDDSNSSTKERLYIKNDASSTQSQGAIKKKIRSRLKSQKTIDTDEEEEETKRNCHKKVTRTRSVSESGKNEVVVDESIIQKVVVPTQSNIVDSSCVGDKNVDSPVTVFVKTTRKLFTPLVESGMKEDSVVTHLPPLPNPSPVPQRKIKDISPSIRIMMAKYNQDTMSAKSANSSGSASPVAWRSPSSERRVKAQTEKYQEELKKSVQKSASVGFLHKQNVPPLSKSSSVPKVEVDPKKLSSELRLQKIQKAKEEFMAATSAPIKLPEETIKFPQRNRLSQISVESSESSYGSACGTLIKSASAGMINIEPEAYKQFDPEVRGYVSLPRNTKKPKEGFLGGKFAFSNIASKFRKVKMRKGKEKEGRMNTVSTLCRQSLLVDITGEKVKECEKEEVSPSTSRSSSWIKKFKK